MVPEGAAWPEVSADGQAARLLPCAGEPSSRAHPGLGSTVEIRRGEALAADPKR